MTVLRRMLCLAAFIGVGTSAANASVVATISIGRDGVLTTIEGSLDLSEFGSKRNFENAFAGNFFDAQSGSVSLSKPNPSNPRTSNKDVYYVLGDLTAFGIRNNSQLGCRCTEFLGGGTFSVGTVGRRNAAGLVQQNIVFGLTGGYQSGDNLFAEMIARDRAVAFGLEVGTFVTELPGDQTFTVVVEPSTVPLPASLPLLGAGLIGFFGLKRRKSAADKVE